jgi:hypothetical protein
MRVKRLARAIAFTAVVIVFMGFSGDPQPGIPPSLNVNPADWPTIGEDNSNVTIDFSGHYCAKYKSCDGSSTTPIGVQLLDPCSYCELTLTQQVCMVDPVNTCTQTQYRRNASPPACGNRVTGGKIDTNLNCSGGVPDTSQVCYRLWCL